MVWWIILGSNCYYSNVSKIYKINIAFGGTSILIVVGVALETVQQLESQLSNETL